MAGACLVSTTDGRGGTLGAAFRNAISRVSRPPRVSYTAKSSRAQWRHLSRTKAGRQALEAAGVSPSPQTLRRWAAGTQQPGKANASKITAAYRTMRLGEIPPALKRGDMKITGRVGTGNDIRERGTHPHSALLIDLGHGDWDRIDAAWALEGFGSFFDDEDDSDGGGEFLEDLISEDLISEDIGGSDGWYFPGGSYTVTITY
jgi:hypothetical protein